MNSYYSPTDILTSAQKVPCTFDLTIPNLPSQIHAGTTHSLPLWCATLLAVQRLGPSERPVCSLDLPEWLNERVLNALKADPKSVDLRALVGGSGGFYEGSARCLELFEEDEVVDVLVETFKKRALEIADHAHNPRGAMGEGAEFLRGLDELERQLFRAAHDGARDLRSWMGEVKKKS